MNLIKTSSDLELQLLILNELIETLNVILDKRYRNIV
jgi:hypothetical protein